MNCTRIITFIILSSSIILSSCGGGNSSIKKTSGLDALLSAEQNISTEERNIATRICYAYQSKSKNFRGADYLGTRFVFSGKNTDCMNNIFNYQIPTNLKYDNGGNLAYIPQSTFDASLSFMGVVQTDTSGYVSQLCTKIRNNEPISNTTTLQNIKVQISFLRDGLDSYILRYFSKQADNSYKITSAEQFKVRTQTDYINGQILGMDEYYSSQKVCGNQLDKNQYSNFEQTFTSR